MDQQAKLTLHDLDQAQRQLDDLTASKGRMLLRYQAMEERGRAALRDLWSRYRATTTDTTGLPAIAAE